MKINKTTLKVLINIGSLVSIAWIGYLVPIMFPIFLLAYCIGVQLAMDMKS